MQQMKRWHCGRPWGLVRCC